MKIKLPFKYLFILLLLNPFVQLKAIFDDPTAPTPRPPSSVTASSSGSNVNLSWSSNETGNLANHSWREEINGSWTNTWNDVPATNSTTTINLNGKANGSYRYEVKTCHALATPSCSIASVSNAVTVDVIPSVPSSINISDGSSSTDGAYTVSWGTSSNSPTSYQYRESTNGSWGSWISNGTSRSKTISGKGNGTYAYQARGCNSAGCGSARTSSNVVVSLPVAPGIPSSLASSNYNVTNGSLTLSWGTASGSVSYYQTAHRNKPVGGSFSSWTYVNRGTALSYSYTGLSDDEWDFAIRACNSAGCSGWRYIATHVQVSTPPAAASGWENTGGSVPDAAWSGDTPVLNGNTNVGALEGSGGVSGGAATYNIPIVIPPGRAGMQPSVSLNYSSRSGNGIAGVGWSLSAGSSIHRCSATAAQDKYGKGVTYSTSDKLCLDGQRLIKYSGTYGQSGATYRTEIDLFAKIVQSGAINSSSSFTVYHKDGRISKYGLSSNSQHKAGGKSQIMSWAIAEVQDRSGNTITYDYFNYANGENLLSAINYTGTNGADGDRKVTMIYETRPDISRSYLAGGLTASTKRIQKVQTQYQSQVIREYKLRYGTVSETSNRTLLRGVTECSLNRGNFCLPETTFDWYENDISWGLKENYISSFDSNTPDGHFMESFDIVKYHDLDGDGRKELFYWDKVENDPRIPADSSQPVFSIKVYFLDAHGNIDQSKSNNPISLSDYSVFTNYSGAKEGDLTLDGKTDFLSVNRTTGQLAVYQYKADGTGFDFFPTNISGINIVYFTSFEVVDLNGDGYQDLISKGVLNGQASVFYYENLADGSLSFKSPQKLFDIGINSSVNFRWQDGNGGLGDAAYYVYDDTTISDLNNDGIQDFIIINSKDPKKVKSSFTFGSRSGATISYNSPTLISQFGLKTEDANQSFWADINGDGLLDYLRAENSNGFYWAVNINNGNGTFTNQLNTGTGVGIHSWNYPTNNNSYYLATQALFKAAIPVDYDSDGTTELLVATSTDEQACVSGLPWGGTFDLDDFIICDDNLHRRDKVTGDPREVNEDRNKEVYSQYDLRSYDWSIIKFTTNENGTVSNIVKPNVLHAGIPGGMNSIEPTDFNLDGLIDFKVRQKKGICRDFKTGVCGTATLMNPHIMADSSSPLSQGTHIYINKGAIASSDDIFFSQNRQTDMLKSSTTGLDSKHIWNYDTIARSGARSLTDIALYDIPTDRYISNNTNRSYFYFASSMPVVSEMEQSNGIGGLNKTRYSYREAIYNRLGRGFQGFHSIIVDDLSDVDPNKQVRSVSDFHQKFPLAGQLEQTRTCLISSGGEDCSSRPINKTFYKWDLWRNAVKKQTVDTALEDFSAHVLDGSTTDYLYWVSPYNQYSYNYETDSAHGADMTVGTNWISHNYQNFAYNSNGCQTYSRKVYLEDSSRNRSESYTNNYYQTADANNWWLCKPNYSLTTTKAVSARDVSEPYGFAGVESGADTQKQVRTNYVMHATHRKPTKITTYATQGQGTANNLYSVVDTVYNSHGLPTSVISTGDHYTGSNMSQRSVSTTYSTDGYFVKTVTNSKGHVTTTTVDPIHGQATQVTDPNKQVTTMTYDAFGRVRSTKLPGEPTAWVAYHWCSEVNGGSISCSSDANRVPKYRIMTRALGKPNSFAYKDMLNREVRSQTRNFTDSSYYYSDTAYNNKGQTIWTRNLDGGKGLSWQYTYFDSYDALGRLAKKRTPQSDGSYMATSYTYNGFVTDIEAIGESTLNMSRKYNGLGQLVYTKDALGGYTRYAYDGAGNPITLQDANGNKIYAKYNALGHKEYVDDPNMGIKNFWYNTFGEVEKETDANGDELTYSYDDLGRIVWRWTNGNVSGYWGYDSNASYGRKGMLDVEYNTSFNLDRRIKYYRYATTTSGKDYLHWNVYNTYENNVTNTNQHFVYYYLDNNFGRPKGMKYNTTGLTLAYDYNDRGYMTKIKNANGGYVYQEIKDLDAHGKITNQLRANGILTELANYHPATGQMMDIRSSMTSGDSLRHELTYQYDGFSNLHKQMVSTTGGVNSEEYQYDGLHRLTNSYREFYNSTAPVNINYAYDAVGNFTNKSDYGSSYLYGNQGKTAGGNAGPNAVRQLSKVGGGTATFTYDNNGNMETGDGKTITYNEFNKPLTISKGGVTSTFSYGADLMRYKQVKTGATGGTITTYYIDKLLEKEVQGSTTKYKHYIGDVAIQTKKNSTWDLKFTHRDRLGSVVTITDHMGNLAEHRSYDPFGKPRKGDFSDVNPPTLTAVTGLTQMNRTTERGFTDHEHLDDHELIHMNGRAYDYNLGRFLSVDPFIQAPGNSQSMNPYSYIMNNPLSGTDPSGYKSICGVKGKRSCDAITYPNGSSGFVAAIELKNGATVYVNTKALKNNKINEAIESIDLKDVNKISVYDNFELGWDGALQISGGTQELKSRELPTSRSSHEDTSHRRDEEVKIKKLMESKKKEDRLEAMRLTIAYYGIDTTNLRGLFYDPKLKAQGQAGPWGNVYIGPEAFEGTVGFLGITLAHEITIHIDEHSYIGKRNWGGKRTQQGHMNEVEAYQWELDNMHKFNLSEQEQKWMGYGYHDYYRQLTPQNQKRADLRIFKVSQRLPTTK